MDVRCARCATEYEFDDALISERGTTVKCTNCGFQFKIFPPKAAAVAPERWLVRTADAREVVYTSLRELQRGISDRQVGPNDLLSRGGAPPRPLGSIPELEPFFAASSTKAAQRAPRTLHGVAPPAGVGASPSSSRAAPPPAASSSSANPMAATVASPGPMAPVAPAPARVESAPLSATLPVMDQQKPAVFVPAMVDEPPPRSVPISSRAPDTVSSPVRATPEPTPAPKSVRRESFASYDDFPPEGTQESGRRARSRWIAAIVILGVVGLFAATVGRQYLVRGSAKPTASAKPTDDGRVATFLKDGTRLLDEGDFEGAKEQLVKAQALADKNPAVLTALARLETMRADMYWLRLRLLDPASTELVQSTHRELGRRVGKARQAVDSAFALAPEDTVVVRARIDALRLSGEADKAREWVSSLGAADPENAYVLAALDMAAAEPKWPGIIEQLRKAAAAHNLRARAALIYALAQSGAVDDAQAEFAKLEGDEKGHPLLDELKAFTQRVKVVVRDAGTGADAAAPIATVDVSKLPALDTSPGPDPGARPEPAGDFRQRLVRASSALKAGNLAEAEALYQGVLNEQPGNTEALSGLADVARRRNDHATASKLYQKVLDQNPSYLPALMASADSKWASGDRKGAVTLYRRVLEQAGPGSEYGQRASARIAEAGKDGEQAAPAPTTAPAPTAAPAPAPTPAPGEQPHIDTSDLPGFNK